jgi:carboxymethylenebutenolidase
MTERAISAKKVQISNGNLPIDAYLAIPQGNGPFNAIIVVQEIFGVNSHIRDVTERIAKQGYIAIAPAMFQRLAPGFETGYNAEDVTIGREYKNRTIAGEILSDIQATIDYLKQLPQVKPDGFGCIGFCFGGHIAYLAATLDAIVATASFYGAGITTWTPGDGVPTVTKTPEIKGTIYTFFGMEDASIPFEQVDLIEAELKKYNIKHKVLRYQGADHGFFCDRRASYNRLAAENAWQQVLKLFSDNLH